jgi:DNA-binding winged helix-turn-helix (wHTH) protein
LPLLEKAEASARRTGNSPARLEALALSLRAAIELERSERVAWVEMASRETLRFVQGNKRLESRSYALLGACARARPSGAGQAEAFFKRAVDLALEAGDHEAVAQAAYGGASALYAQGRYECCLTKLNCLDALLPSLRLAELTSAALLLRGLTWRELGRFDEATKSIWAACEALRAAPHLAIYARALAALGSVLRATGSARDGRLYLDLSEMAARPDDMLALRRLISAELGATRERDAAASGPWAQGEISFDQKAGVLRLQGREVRLEGQFLLRDLMAAFVRRPGHPFGKAEIASIIWREPYDPAIHDNKIYVTIKRLRRCLDDGRGGRRYVLRAKDGYFFNPKIRVTIV